MTSKEEPESLFDIAGIKFRWPGEGDQLFKSADRYTDADLNPGERLKHYLIQEGYKKSADILVKQSTSSRLERDSLVYPIIFCYRHYLELALKSLLASYGEPDWKSHDLDLLWQKFEKMLSGYEVPDNGTDRIVGRLVAEFAKIDPVSFSFRYPVDKKGAPILLSQDSLDLEQLADVMDGISGYFDGCDGYLSDLVSAGPG